MPIARRYRVVSTYVGGQLRVVSALPSDASKEYFGGRSRKDGFP